MLCGFAGTGPKISGSIRAFAYAVINMHHPHNSEYWNKEIQHWDESYQCDNKTAAINRSPVLADEFFCFRLSYMVTGSTFKELPTEEIAVERNG